MKYKVAALIVCLLGAVVALTVQNLAKTEEKVVYHQHIEEKNNEVRKTAYGFSTHLPVVSIETDGVKIPGAAITDGKGNIIGNELTEDGNAVITCNLTVDDCKHGKSSPTAENDFTTKAEIHIRGNSSRAFDKPNYALRFITEDGENNPQAVMGMGKHHEWVLHGPFLDKSLIRNYMWYNIAGEIMDYAPCTRFCEVVLNGEYRGLYVMIEVITAGDENCRLNLSANSKDVSYSGYILRMDRGSDVDIKNIEPFSFYSHHVKRKFNIVFPGKNNLNEELSRSICEDFSDFEKVLYSYDYDNDKYGYENYIDVQSFVDYVIINEFTCNYDAGHLSTYIYKDLDGKFRMCIWDFNSACDYYRDSLMNPQGFALQSRPWFFMLMKDGRFTDKIIERYRELRKTFLSDEYLEDYIDETVAYLGSAVDRNFEFWGYTFEGRNDYLIPVERNPRNYAETTAQLKDFIRKRGAWLDENIEAIKSYSAESSVKKFNDHAN